MSAAPTGAPDPARVRASDVEREEYARILRDAVGEGRLGLDEGDERLATVYAAKYRDELRPVVADLPREDDAREYGRERATAHRAAPPANRRDRVGPDWHRYARRGFARHLGFVAVVTTVLIGIWALTGSQFFWPAIPLAFIAVGLVRRACWAGWARREWYERQRSSQV